MQNARGASLSGADTPAALSGARPARPRRIGILLTVAVLVWGTDQITKLVAMRELADRDPVELAGGALTLRLVRNSGAAFGLAAGATIVLTLVAVAVVVAILRTARQLRSVGWALALGLILGGAVGNLTDRLVRDPAPLRGHVVDFLQLPHWPVFNVADSAICTGAGVVLLMSLLGRALDGSRSQAAGATDPEADDRRQPGDRG